METPVESSLLERLELELAVAQAAPDRGDDGLTVVLLHAFPLDERMWAPQRTALADYEVAAPRLYGRGRAMEAWAESLLRELPGRLVLVGASMGGYCALAMLRQAPERVPAVVLVGARPDADSPERRAGRAETIALIEREGAAGLWQAMRQRLLAEDAAEEVVEDAQAVALDQDPAELVEAVEAIRDRLDGTEEARALGDALLLAVGEHDGFFGMGEALALGMGQVEVFEGAAHLPSLERPDDFNRALLEFLAKWR